MIIQGRNVGLIIAKTQGLKREKMRTFLVWFGSISLLLVFVGLANGQSLTKLDLTAAKYKQPVDDGSLVWTQQTSTNTSSYTFPTAEKRAKRYALNVVGPFAFGRAALSAGLDQWNDEPEEWGQGGKAYGKRFASNFGKNVIRQTVTYGLSEAFRLDTGFERSKRKGFWPRLSDALVQNVTSRTRSGKRVLSAPIFIGTYAGAVIPAETWYPSRYSYKDGLRSGTYSLAAGFGINVVREFIIKW